MRDLDRASGLPCTHDVFGKPVPTFSDHALVFPERIRTTAILDDGRQNGRQAHGQIEIIRPASPPVSERNGRSRRRDDGRTRLPCADFPSRQRQRAHTHRSRPGQGARASAGGRTADDGEDRLGLHGRRLQDARTSTTWPPARARPSAPCRKASSITAQNKKPEWLTCLHEEVSVGMAHGYAKVAGKPMAAMVHGTVGTQHASMAIYNAYCDRVPIVALHRQCRPARRAPARRRVVPQRPGRRGDGARLRQVGRLSDVAAALRRVDRARLCAAPARNRPVRCSSSPTASCRKTRWRSARSASSRSRA